jgi:hypothetical protein
MTAEEFVRALHVVVREDDVIRTLEKPPGRRPARALVARSEWYRSLTESDRARVADVAAEATRAALFHVLAIIDGVSAIENTAEKGELVLSFRKDGTEVRLNPPEGEMLHDIFQSLSQPVED